MSLAKCTAIIPARMGSKGLPFKNRKLIPITIDLATSLFDKIIVTTDDPKIKDYCIELGKENIIVRDRPDELASDIASMKETIQDVIDFYKLSQSSDLVILYPTYPERNENDVRKVYDFYINNNLKSSLCSKQVKTHPYMCLLESNDIYGKSLISHELYRRQEYPKCFEISHFIVIIKTSEIKKLNNQMFNDSTGFYKISQKIDVDYIEDLEKYKK